MSKKPAASKPTISSSSIGVPLTAVEQDIRTELFKSLPGNNPPGGKIVTLSNASGGERYEGQVHSDTGKRHGKGLLKWPNKNCYVGEWEDGAMNGTGTFLYASEGDRYDGDFKEDKKHGNGTYVFQNGNRYCGCFSSDKRHGAGKYTWVCGDSYDGEWQEGRMHGRGTTIYANGNRYEGQFIEDRREGKGKLVCTDGLSYDGEWLKNNRHGQGRLDFASGDHYTGEWTNDKKHGRGKDVHANGNVFEGLYHQNAKSGEGFMKYANGDRYEGEWSADKMHGRGRYTFANGFVYHGEWVADTRHGFGIYRFPTGHVYRGSWANDRRHGQGVLTLNAKASPTAGESYIGVWQEGKMHGEFSIFALNPDADLLDPNDSDFVASSDSQNELFKAAVAVAQKGHHRLYEGRWTQGVPSGKGTYFMPLQVTGKETHDAVMVLRGEWNTEGATKNSDGTIERVDGSVVQLASEALQRVLGQRSKPAFSSSADTIHEDSSSVESQICCSLVQDPFGTRTTPSSVSLLAELTDHPLSHQGEVVANHSDSVETALRSLPLPPECASALVARVSDVDQKIFPQLAIDLEEATLDHGDAASTFAAIHKHLESVDQAEQSTLRNQLQSKRSALDTARMRVEELEHTAESVMVETRQAVDRTKGSEQNLASLKHDKEQLAQKQKEAAQLEQTLHHLARKVQDSTQSRDRQLTDAATAEADLAKLRAEKLAALEHMKSQNMERLKEVSSAIKSHDAKHVELQKRFGTESARVFKEGKEAKAQVANLTEAVQELESKIASWESKETELEKDLELAQAEKANWEAENESAVRQFEETLSTQRQCLETILADLKEQRTEAEESEKAGDTAEAHLVDATSRMHTDKDMSTSNEATISDLNDKIKQLQDEERQHADSLSEIEKRQADHSRLLALRAAFNKELLEKENAFLEMERNAGLQRQQKLDLEGRVQLKREAVETLRRDVESKRAALDGRSTPPPQGQSAASRLRRMSQRSATPPSEGPNTPTSKEDSPEGKRKRGGKSKRSAFGESKRRHAQVEDEIARLQQQQVAVVESVSSLKRKVTKKQQRVSEYRRALAERDSNQPQQGPLPSTDDDDPFPKKNPASSASREAAMHQLMKQRSTFNRLFKEKQNLESQLVAQGEEEEDDFDLHDSKNEHDRLIRSLLQAFAQDQKQSNADWRTGYLVDQIESRRKTIQELENEARVVPLLEEKLAALTATIQEARSRSSGSFYKREPL